MAWRPGADVIQAVLALAGQCDSQECMLGPPADIFPQGIAVIPLQARGHLGCLYGQAVGGPIDGKTIEGRITSTGYALQ